MITAVEGKLRIYTTTIPAKNRRVTLMQDPIYRNDVTMVSMGYFYPPQLSYYMKD
jgi:rhamnogalacturonan endolyase